MKAFLFDLNGTMIDDMQFHTDAWFDIINNDLRGNLTNEEVKLQMYGKNQEVLIRVFGEGRFSEEEMNKISLKKEKKYQEVYKPHLRLLNGLDAFLREAHQRGIKMAIGSAAITGNVDFVLDGLGIREYFPVIVSADVVKKSKPDPETFLLAAEKLGARPEDCLVFEDNPKGVQAAHEARMSAVVITSMHTKEEFDGLPNILKFITDYTDPYLKDLLL